MTIPSFSMRQLLESGVHFGHHTRRWNPKMAPFIYGVRNKIHIINLEETVPLLNRALQAIRDVAASGGRVLFVGTKKSISDIVAESAKNCGQYYVNHRWLGGMMTNFSTVSQSISRLKKIDERLESDEINALSKKEILKLTREREKLNNSLGGIREMGGLPDMLFVIDTIKDSIAISEAKVLKIPVMAIIDSNSDPDNIDYPVPGNDDAMRAVSLYCNLVSESILDGLKAEMINRDQDIGESKETLVEPAINNENNDIDKIKSDDNSNLEKGPELSSDQNIEESNEVAANDKPKSKVSSKDEKVSTEQNTKQETYISKSVPKDEKKPKTKEPEKKVESKKKENKKSKVILKEDLEKEKPLTEKDNSKATKGNIKEKSNSSKSEKDKKPVKDKKIVKDKNSSNDNKEKGKPKNVKDSKRDKKS